MRDLIVSQIPDHSRYVEAFGGAAWVLFAKPSSKEEVYNDLNGELSNFFRIVQTAPRALIDFLMDMLDSRDLFETLKAADIEAMNEIERAARYFYINRCSFSSRGWNFGGHFDRLHKSDRISLAYKRLQGVRIENLDYAELIKRYDSKNSFFYLDPPYDCEEARFYYAYFQQKDYQKLNLILSNLKGKFLLSINNSDFMKKTFGKFNIAEVPHKYSIGQEKKTVQELLISNYILKDFNV